MYVCPVMIYENRLWVALAARCSFKLSTCLWGADYQVAESFGLQLDYSDETSDFRDTTFPARYIYERVLPKAVAEHSDIHYHRGSPYSGHGKPTTDRTYGDIHQCESNPSVRCCLVEYSD
jgi:hypothetical protein